MLRAIVRLYVPILALKGLLVGCAPITTYASTPPQHQHTRLVSVRFGGQAQRDRACLSSMTVPGYPGAKVFDCWVGTLQGHSFLFATWTTPPAQGILLQIHKRVSVKDTGTAVVYAFRGQYVCWKQGAMANAGAMNLLTGRVVLSGSGGQWESICPPSEGVASVEGLPQKFALVYPP